MLDRGDKDAITLLFAAVLNKGSMKVEQKRKEIKKAGLSGISIEESFAVGNQRIGRYYPLYVTWEDFSAGVVNILLAASYNDGATWTAPIQVNDNASPVDEFQPNLDVAANGTVSVAFYDRRLACPAAGTAEAAAAGVALDTANANWSGPLPPYGAANYCVNASIQFYTPSLAPKGNNIRLTQHTWDPQLHSPHTSCPTCLNTFIGDYFGNTSAGGKSYTTSVTTYDDGTNPAAEFLPVLEESAAFARFRRLERPPGGQGRRGFARRFVGSLTWGRGGFGRANPLPPRRFSTTNVARTRGLAASPWSYRIIAGRRPEPARHRR